MITTTEKFLSKIAINIKLGEKFHSYNIGNTGHVGHHYTCDIYCYKSSLDKDGQLLFIYNSIDDLFEINNNKYTEEQMLKILDLMVFI